jgi:dephospho-CoA kinase
VTSDRKPVIGLTGGIASGKSSVAALLAQQGAAVVDADQLAREVVAPGSEGLREITAAFGEHLLNADGGLDRDALGALVFRDPTVREALQRITHPRIGALSAQRVQEHQRGDALYILYDAPLLVEVGAHRGMDALIVVAASTDHQVARAKERNGLDEGEARRRIAAQLPLHEKTAVADYVIANDGTLEQLSERTLAVHSAIVQRFGLSGRQKRG